MVRDLGYKSLSSSIRIFQYFANNHKHVDYQPYLNPFSVP